MKKKEENEKKGKKKVKIKSIQKTTKKRRAMGWKFFVSPSIIHPPSLVSPHIIYRCPLTFNEWY